MSLRSLIKRLLTRKVYKRGHLFGGADGSLYMGRYALFETRYLSARVHFIAREDRDLHLHDHPWWFLSLVLSGWYLEARPIDINPCFDPQSGLERTEETLRRAGSLAFRRATDRHQIVEVAPSGAWTLFITGPLVQWWGFFTPRGKVYWRDYLGANKAAP